MTRRAACCAPAARRGWPGARCRGARCAGRGRAGGRGRRAPGPRPRRSRCRSARRSATMNPSRSPRWATGATRTGSSVAAVEQRRHPHRQPGVARHLGAGRDAALVGSEVEARRRAVGHGDGQLVDAVAPGPHLGRRRASSSCAASRPAGAGARPSARRATSGWRTCAAPPRAPPARRRPGGWRTPRAGGGPGARRSRRSPRRPSTARAPPARRPRAGRGTRRRPARTPR